MAIPAPLHPAAPATPPPSRRYALYALGIIFFANFLSYLDRQIVSVLEEELKLAFTLDKKQFGLLWTAFTVGYMVFSPVIGLMIDRVSRTRTFAVCIFLWSLATIASGLAATKDLMYVSRFFIGIGEAGCLVIGPTLIADYFAKEFRGRALSIFFLGLPLGGVAGYIAGAFMADHFGWRTAFYVAGGPGILVAILVWLLTDPPRGGAAAPAHASGGLSDYLGLLRNRTLFLIILAQAFAVIILVPLLHFGVGFFQAERAMGKKEASTILGAVILFAGAAGNLLSGVIGDRLNKKMRGAYALLAAAGFTLGLPFLVAGFTFPDKGTMVVALGLGAFCYFLCMPAVNTQIANVVSPKQRPMAFAMAVFILHLLGDTFAPPVFGEVADWIGTQATFGIFSLFLLLSGACCYFAFRTAGVDEQRAALESGEFKPAAPETGTG